VGPSRPRSPRQDGDPLQRLPHLARRVLDESGILYGAHQRNWIGKVLVAVADRNATEGGPLLTSLCVSSGDEKVGAGYAYALKIAGGAESTGTTTIVEHLTQHYAARGGVWAATQYVAEYGRECTRLNAAANPDVDVTEVPWNAEDFDAIGSEQTRREEAAARAGSRVLICDTDAFATALWKRRYP
jgi:hypothetical protein